MIETKNALIESTMLGYEDHGIFSFNLWLEFDCGCQAAGGYCLDKPLKKDNKFICRVGTKKGMQLIIEVLKTIGVEKWEDLPGKYIRIKADMSQVYEIGNLLKDKWLNFKDFFSD